MGEYICNECGIRLATKQALNRHLTKKQKCTDKQFQCEECKAKFSQRTSLNYHRKHLCKGKQVTTADRDKHIESLQTALAASHGLKTNIEQSSQQTSITDSTFNNCHIGDVNNIQININVLPIGQENVDHLKNMSMDQIRKKIGLTPDASTMIELFKLVRLDKEHPENHNLLLTSKDSNKIHYYEADGWKEGCFNERIREALLDDKFRLRDMIGVRNRDDKFYWGYLEHHVGQKINERDHIALKPIIDGIRDPLLESTLKLAAVHDEHSIRLNDEKYREIQKQILETENDKILEIEKTKARQLELELEIMKLKIKSA